MQQQHPLISSVPLTFVVVSQPSSGAHAITYDAGESPQQAAKWVRWVDGASSIDCPARGGAIYSGERLISTQVQLVRVL
jgi:hypothetical protein